MGTIERRRLGMAIGAILIWLAITTGHAMLSPEAATTLDDMATRRILWPTFAAAAFLLLIARLFRWPDLGLNIPRTRGLWGVAWLPVLHIAAITAFVAAAGESKAPDQLAIGAINLTGIAFGEELAFRGILWGAARKALPFWPAFLLVPGLFGVAHMANAPLTGDLEGAIVQSVAAFLSGVGWLALRIHVRSLLPVMLLHWVWNFVLLGFGAGPAETAGMSLPFLERLGAGVALVLPMFVYGLWLIRNEAARGNWRSDSRN